jgi:hypothetical protein
VKIVRMICSLFLLEEARIMRLNKKMLEQGRILSFIGSVDFYKSIDGYYCVIQRGRQIARCKSYSAARLVLTSILNGG